MTTFETELVRAIEHGCPECGSDDLMVTSNEVAEYRVSPCWHGIDWKLYETVRSTDIGVHCYDCGKDKLLWTIDRGWIPELAEIVKGE